jgi:hypothetical protein
VVYKGRINQGALRSTLMYNLKINLTKVYPSFDSSFFAAFEKGGSKVFIGDLQTNTTNITILDYG